MMSTVERPAPTPAVPARRRRGLLRSLLAGFVFLVSGAVVVATPDNAQAALGADIGAVTVGTAVRSVGSKIAVRAGAAAGADVACGPGAPLCLAVTTAVVAGFTVWETRDIWLPWVNDWMSNGAKTDSGPGCVQLSAGISGDRITGSITVPGSNVGCGTDLAAVAYQVQSVKDTTGSSCGSGFGGQAGSTGPFGSKGPWGPFAFTTAAPCASGKSIGSAMIRADIQYSSTHWYSPWKTLSVGWSKTQNTQTSTADCSNVLTGASQSISKTTVGEPDKYVVPSCEKALGDPWHPKNVQISVGPDAATQHPVANFGPRESDFYTRYSDCFSQATGAMVCRVKVVINNSPCTIGDGKCYDWQQWQQDHPEDLVECKWGPYVVAMADCQALKRAYRTGTETRTITRTNVDGSVNTETDTVTGPSTSPSPSPTGPPEACQVNCVRPPVPEDPPLDPQQQENCMAGTFSLNPVDWVLTPVKCALVWAFVPKTGLQTRVQRTGPGFEGRLPFALLAPILTMPTLGVGQDCPDWRIKVPGPNGSSLFDENIVCDSSFTTAIHNSRPFLAAGMIVLAFWPLVRGTIYASFPIIKPVPTDPGR